MGIGEEFVDDAGEDGEVGAVLGEELLDFGGVLVFVGLARGDWTAGPLDLLSIRNWMPVASMAWPISPPRASISRTIWPLARPPMAGLQDIRPMARGSMVTMATPPFAIGEDVGGGVGGFGAGVAAADDEDVEGCLFTAHGVTLYRRTHHGRTGPWYRDREQSADVVSWREETINVA